MMADWWMRTMLNDYKIAKCYILNDYKFILNNRIQFYLDFNWKFTYGRLLCTTKARKTGP